MKLYQLFKSPPPIEFLHQFLLCYGLSGLDDVSEFHKGMLKERRTVEKLYDILPELVLYYIPCKAQKYLNDITEDRAITILRQFLRLFEHELSKKERVINRKKIIYYSIHPKNHSTIQIQTHQNTILLD